MLNTKKKKTRDIFYTSCSHCSFSVKYKFHMWFRYVYLRPWPFCEWTCLCKLGSKTTFLFSNVFYLLFLWKSIDFRQLSWECFWTVFSLLSNKRDFWSLCEKRFGNENKNVYPFQKKYFLIYCLKILEVRNNKIVWNKSVSV